MYTTYIPIHTYIIAFRAHQANIHINSIMYVTRVFQASSGPLEHEADYFNYNTVYDYLSAAYAKLNDTSAAIIWGRAFEATAPKDSDDKDRAAMNLDHMVGSSDSLQRQDIYGDLCRQDISIAPFHPTLNPNHFQTPQHQQFWPDAECFYADDGYNHRIGITSLSRPPGNANISIWHGIVSDEEAEHLKSLAVNHLRVSTIVDPETGVQQQDTYRTSQGAWLDHGSDPVVDRLNERIARFTNKGLASMEELHVVRYVPGEKYETHFDFSDPNREQANWSDRSQEPMGNRHMSLIIFLDHPQKGGSTVFPTQRVKLNPKKGDAVFFVNLRSNGFPDHTTHHGGCPVDSGEKWIAVKWIREVRHPTGLEWEKVTPSQLVTPEESVWR